MIHNHASHTCDNINLHRNRTPAVYQGIVSALQNQTITTVHRQISTFVPIGSQ